MYSTLTKYIEWNWFHRILRKAVFGFIIFYLLPIKTVATLNTEIINLSKQQQWYSSLEHANVSSQSWTT
jgi:hypothetical protein